MWRIQIKKDVALTLENFFKNQPVFWVPQRQRRNMTKLANLKRLKKKKSWSYSSCKAWSQKTRAVYSLSSALGLTKETWDLLFWTLALLGWCSVSLPRWTEAISINQILLTKCSVSQTFLSTVVISILVLASSVLLHTWLAEKLR